MINIIIDKQGRPSKSSIFLGNQHENLDETLQFFFPKEYEDHYRYIAYCYKDRRTGKKITGISPLVEDAFKVTSAITKCAGMWQLYVICKTTQIDETATIIDLTANNSTGEHIFISDAINGRISGNDIDIEAFENIAVDENIKILYDDILSLKLRVEKNEEARQSQENIRQITEANRANAESQRVSAEQSRVEHENARIDNEDSRQSAERTRAESENTRKNAENARVQAEQSRVVAESKRVETEKTRVNVETSRDIEENKRANAENLRKQAESARVSAETLRSQSETTRMESEKTRVNAENARKQAEQSRVNVESQRVSTETERATAETERATAETARAEAETTRANNEQERISNEASRVSAEQERVTAEEQREGVITKLREDVDNNTKGLGKTARSLSALWDLNKGISYRFETDSEKAYQKTIPTGAKLGAVNKVGGRTIVFNQYANINGTQKYWSDDSGYYENLDELSSHKLYIMNKCVVTRILYDKEIYVKRLILFDGNDEGVVNVGNTNIKKADMAVGKIFISKEIVQAPSSLKRIRLYNIGDDETGITAECDSWVNVIDLTKMFGSGNEPSTVEEFEAMFPNGYYLYNEGELMSMGTNEVVNVGKNIFKCKGFSCGFYGSNTPHLNNIYGTSINTTEPSNSVTVTQTKAEKTDTISSYMNGVFSVSLEPIVINKKYVFSLDITPTNMLISNPYVLPITEVLNFKIETIQQDLQVGKKTKLYFELSVGNKKLTQIEFRVGGISGVFENFQLEEGTTATAYSPYHEAIYTIPQAIRDLDGYGWGVGTAYNYVDYENKKFVKNVERVDLGSLNFKNDDEHYSFFSKDLRGYTLTNSNDIVPNIVCAKYEAKPQGRLYNKKDTTGITVSAINDGYLFINDSSFSNVETFKNSLQGVYLYYELAGPIVTDISDIIEDTFQEPFKVESNGSLTFKNVNGDDYQVAVPNEEQYTIKLSEVTS